MSEPVVPPMSEPVGPVTHPFSLFLPCVIQVAEALLYLGSSKQVVAYRWPEMPDSTDCGDMHKKQRKQSKHNEVEGFCMKSCF